VSRYVVARVDDVPVNGHIVVDVNGRSIGIFRVDGEFHGLFNRCPHRGGPMCEGQLVGELNSARPGEYRRDGGRTFLECPWHGWEFDIRTGQSYFDPRRTRLRPYEVQIEHGDAVTAELADEQHSELHMLPGPYLAERVAISVEDDYLVIDTDRRQTTDQSAEEART
jgi:nitrite reductase/ring-hydroxylating ferredoxin subunit